MKALILAGGRGSRLNELTKERNKSMVELLGKPLIEYNLDQVVEINAEEIVIVVGYRKEEIIRRIGEEYRGIKVTYVVQKEQKGLVNAIETAKEAIGENDFILMLGDEILINSDLKGMTQKFKKEELFAICGVTFEKDKKSIGKTYTAMVNEKGRIFRLIEKPKVMINKIKGTGHCMFRREIFKYIQKTPINANRGEKELVDLIQCAVDEGKKVYVYPLTRKYVNVNTREDLEIAEKMMLKSSPRVLIVHPQMKFFGGAELLIVELANWLTKRGIKNDILTASVSKEVEVALENTGIVIPKNRINITSTGFRSIEDILNFLKIFRKEIKRIKSNYDVINFHNFPATWILYPAKMPSVWMLNEPPNLWSKPDAGTALKAINRLRIFADNRIARKMDIICVADEFNQQRCLERYGKKSRLIYYGVNYNFFSKGNGARARKKFNLNGRFVVVQSGVITSSKNQLESIKTIERARETIPEILLVLAGKEDEKYAERIKEYIKNKKLEKYVLLAGNLKREELRDLYDACDIGLFPTGKQGGWLAPFELLCSENPVIVSEEMGAASVIKKFNLGVSTKKYSDALTDIYNNRKEYSEQARKAARHIKKNLSWEIFADKMILAYRDAVRMH